MQGCHTQVTRAEYILLLLSFFAILQGGSQHCSMSLWSLHGSTHIVSKTLTLGCAVGAAGLEIGILAGLIASTFYFAFTYARVRSRTMCACDVMWHEPGMLRSSEFKNVCLQSRQMRRRSPSCPAAAGS